jgi:hypothetical protein
MNSLQKLIAEEESVAHYTTRNIAIDYIFKNKTLKMGALNNLNDPYEAKQAWLNFGSYVTRDEEIEKQRLRASDSLEKEKKIKNVIGEHIKLLCVSVEGKKINGFPETTNFYSNPTMWAHYGDNAQGVCLLFSKEKLNDCIKSSAKHFRIESEKINYIPYSSTHWIDGEKVESYSDDNKKQLFEDINLDVLKQKLPVWEYESEYRWIVCSQKSDELYIPYEDSLKAVVLGINFNLDYLPTLQRQLGNIPIYILDYYLGDYSAILAGDKQHTLESLFADFK